MAKGKIMQTALLKLLQIPQLGAHKIGRLLDEVNFVDFCNYDKQQLRQIGWNEKQILRWFNPEMKWIEAALEWAQKPEQRILSLFDTDYPFLLRQISTAPPILFVRGEVKTLNLPQIAMVGSRDYSHYGEYWAGHFATELVRNQLAITSGLAIGIDSFCHKKALEENGFTVAVLGSGLDNVYPTRHKSLANKIIEQGGALISEFFPNQPPIAENFPRRNRIISGLSLGTLVVEATLNSGSLITARNALEQGREVFALPNAIQTPYSQGCHKLIKEGALLVETIEDILEAIMWQKQPIQTELFPKSRIEREKQTLNTPPKESTQAEQSKGNFVKNFSTLTACQQKIYAQMSLTPIAIDEIAKTTAIDVSILLIELLNLELNGLVKQVSGGYIKT